MSNDAFVSRRRFLRFAAGSPLLAAAGIDMGRLERLFAGTVRDRSEGLALIQQGKAPEALAEIQQEPMEAFRMIGLPMAFHALGRKADADTALASLMVKYGKDAPYDIAYVFAQRGEKDRAFEWLGKSAAAHDPSLALILVERLFAPLHSDPRWMPLLRQIGKDPAAMAKIPFRVARPPAS